MDYGIRHRIGQGYHIAILCNLHTRNTEHVYQLSCHLRAEPVLTQGDSLDGAVLIHYDAVGIHRAVRCWFCTIQGVVDSSLLCSRRYLNHITHIRYLRSGHRNIGSNKHKLYRVGVVVALSRCPSLQGTVSRHRQRVGIDLFTILTIR